MQYLQDFDKYDLVPNTTSYLAIMEGCNYKRRGRCGIALAVFTRFMSGTGSHKHSDTVQTMTGQLLQVPLTSDSKFQRRSTE